ncbi:MAG: Stp1/IreP family PP2C-type Ser/Thr phosphatase [Gammaproteobacteria bacterium]|nr:Stp1/IreP family PP2C-type Ser/Thr phosphatase [Gammaproteobacteria bacterium]MBU1731935.1 Stp1/IreP family PP2C-type Ser/Thr phosphatase [Gammaproteobacteria bacterium]MBU1893073.1 Stp1/IreP family PP2C-type Ser/Thr phosphatase [Gammaproteobacteria bacterium]
MTTNTFTWEFAGATDTGRVRPGNEDAIVWNADSGLALLADGMGGYEGGEIASNLAIKTALESFGKPLAPHWREAEWAQKVSDPILKLYAAVSEANQSVHATALKQTRYEGMGTTFLAAYFHDNRVTLAHIGDSRIYLWRNRALKQLTVDHTMIQERLQNGEITAAEAASDTYRGVLTRALGVDPVVEVDMREVTIQAGDIFLLCSDGCYDMLAYDEMIAIMNACQEDPQQLVRLLVRQANENGGYDNISAVVVRIG